MCSRSSTLIANAEQQSVAGVLSQYEQLKQSLPVQLYKQGRGLVVLYFVSMTTYPSKRKRTMLPLLDLFFFFFVFLWRGDVSFFLNNIYTFFNHEIYSILSKKLITFTSILLFIFNLLVSTINFNEDFIIKLLLYKKNLKSS